MGLAEQIEKKITESFDVDSVEVLNESHMHKGHAGDDGSGESHFKLIILSDELAVLPRVAAQRRVYSALTEEMRYIHALSIEISGTKKLKQNL